MKKIYTLILAMVALVASVQAQLNVALVYNQDPDDAIIQNLKGVLEATSDATVTVTLVAVGDLPTEASGYSSYDAVVISEAMGSSSMAAFGNVLPGAVPYVSLKTYAMNKGNWAWLTSNEFWAAKAEMDSTKVTECTEVEVAEAHPILTSMGYQVGDKFSFADGTTPGQGAEAHIQCVDFSASAVADIANNSTKIGVSTWARDNDTVGATQDGILWAIEENSTSKRGVVFGVHHYYLSNNTDAFDGVLQKSTLWVTGFAVSNRTELVNSLNLKCFPNPATEKAVLSFYTKSADDVTVSLINLAGQEVSVLAKRQAVKGANYVDFNVESFAKGVYFVKVQLGQQVQYNKLVVK